MIPLSLLIVSLGDFPNCTVCFLSGAFLITLTTSSFLPSFLPLSLLDGQEVAGYHLAFLSESLAVSIQNFALAHLFC